MTTYNTGNPVGSTEVKDLYDNAQNFDELVNNRASRSYDDRLGVPRKTWWGMEQDFQDFLINSGYQHIGDYAAGLEITARNQIFWKDGELYRAGAVLELPYTMTGDWASEGHFFVAMGDQSLRQELADSSDPNNGAGMVGRATRQINTVDELRSVSGRYPGDQAELLGHTLAGIGGGRFRWDAGNSAPDDNGLVFAALGGVWRRVISGPVTPLYFGAIGGGAVDDSQALNASFNSGHNVDLGGVTYGIADELAIDGVSPILLSGPGRIKAIGPVSNMLRARNSAHLIARVTIDGANISGTLGINMEASAIGAALIDSTIINTARSALFAQSSRHRIEDNNFDLCGTHADTVGNFRATLYCAEGDDLFVMGNRLRNCQWGIYVRRELTSTANFRSSISGNFIAGKSGESWLDNQGISIQNNTNFHVHHNTVVDFANNGIDMQACNFGIVSDNFIQNCHDGVFIGDRSCVGHSIQGNTMRACVRGVRFINSTDWPGMTFRGISICGNTIHQSSDGAIQATVASTVSTADTVSISDNIIYSEGNGTYGIKAAGLKQSTISRNQFYRQPGHNLIVEACDGVNVESNVFTDPSYGQAGINNAIRVHNASSRIFIRNNYAIGSAGVAFNIVDGSSHTVTGNRWRSIATGVTIGSATNVTQADNLSV